MPVGQIDNVARSRADNAPDTGVGPVCGPALDPREFRTALGRFATGVTVVTACSPDGGLIGVTANSFNSVSLDPPLVLWSLDRTSKGLPLFMAAGHFCVNVLSEEQVDLSRHFATSQLDKFASVDYREGIFGAPVLEGCSASFQCCTVTTHEGGDHLILIGEVATFEYTSKPGLLYHQGRYAASTEHPGFATQAASSGSETVVSSIS